MKRINFTSGLLKLFAGVLVITSLASCDKDDPAPVVQKNIVETAQADTSFSILVSAVVKTGLTSALATTNNITVFAPNNSAFRAAGYTSAIIDGLDATQTAALKTVLQYHVVAERIPSSAITSANIEKATLNPAPNNKIYATKNANGVFINGVQVIAADVSASNGIIHVLGKILLPPVGNLRETAIATPGFSLLVAAVLRADAINNDISNALTGAGPLTVFAPTDAAFNAAGFADVAAINATAPAVLRSILLYHVIPARVYSSDLVNNANVTTALGAPQTVKITLPPARVLGLGNGANASNITATDIMANNGVIHVIDRVLLPQ